MKSFICYILSLNDMLEGLFDHSNFTKSFLVLGYIYSILENILTAIDDQI